MANDAYDLARRFEPILYFHPTERFFPSDAKRYVEHCALWNAVLPFDNKTSWSQLIAPGKITASGAIGELEPGDSYLGQSQPIGPGQVMTTPFLVNTSTEEHFFELGGWRIPVGFPGGEPSTVVANNEGVTAASLNRYADRDEVAKLYLQPALADSRFWYHAELFDTVRLRGLMSSSPQVSRMLPDLSKVFAKLAERNPALLCYYFFFPAHDESLAPPCDASYHGQEFASFAGEWACLALLLFRTTTASIADFRPAYVGYTGRRNAGALQGLDPERRFGMMVDPWKGWQNAQGQLVPETVDEHPKLYVSRGTHSLYLEAGPHVVQSYEAASYPQLCGRFDGPDALDQFRKAHPAPEKESPAAAIAKLAGGFILAGLAGYAAGIVLAALEGNLDTIGSGLDAVGSYPETKAAPDVTPVPGELGKVLHPQNLTLTDPGAEFVPWKADENAPIGDRHYHFIVDRQAQIWWPSDDGTGGYRGRWGSRVVNDPFNRRAGMRFPEFWRMFFVALAKSSPLEFQ